MVKEITTARDLHILRWLGLAMVAVAGLFAAACDSRSEIPATEQRVHDLSKGIMCPVCPGESIDQSQHPLAIQMRAVVQEQVEQGRSNSDIKSYFVERYGPSVLLEPPRTGFDLIVWIVPVLVVSFGGLALFFVVRGMMRPKYAAAAGPTAQPALTVDEKERYIRRIEAAIDSTEGKK